MKPKQILPFAVILFMLIAAVAIKKYVTPSEIATEEYESLDFDFEIDDVWKVRVGKGQETAVELVREENGWRIPERWNARADEDKIYGMIGPLLTAKGEWRGKGDALYQDFALGEKEAFWVALDNASDEPLFKLWLANKRSGFQTSFVRQDGSDEIYVTDKDLLSQLGVFGALQGQRPNMDRWADLRLFHFDEKDVVGLKVSRFKRKKEKVLAEIQKSTAAEDAGPDLWQFTQAKIIESVDQKKVIPYFLGLKNVRARRILDPTDKKQRVDKIDWQMKVTLKDGREITLTASPEDEEYGTRRVRLSTEPVIFLISDYPFQTLDIDDSYFFPDPTEER